MQKVTLVFREPIAKIKDGKPVIEYDEQTADYVVASTKSYNNLIEELKQDNKIATNSIVENIFIDKETTRKAVEAIVNGQIKDDAVTAKAVINHMMSALDKACVFKKPPVVRAKQ